MDQLIKIELPREDWEEIRSSAIYVVNMFEGVDGLVEPLQEALDNLRKLYFTIKSLTR